MDEEHEPAIDEEPETTVDEDAEMEANRQAWIEGLATGAIRFYRRSWRDFEGDENEVTHSDPDLDTPTSEQPAAMVNGDQHVEAIGAEAQQPWETITTATEGGRETEPGAEVDATKVNAAEVHGDPASGGRRRNG
ncbi:hypothetical protein B0A55_11741 [Friedmanniomyces simplex]|uniref:Uncharacterized protein n=1 Tax=Friedmanniomyces simplex TaxID=329884 RepID=A0A4U0WEU8_9PEZI|nr:hypothetical protein B0A55_11741 [Friedmanniomyces simplex]